MELTGVIKLIKDTEVVGQKGFQKRLFVVEVTDGKFAQQIPLEFVKDKVDLLDNYSEGQTVTVEFNLRGSEYNGRYFLSAQAWKISAAGKSSAPAQSAAPRSQGKSTGASRPPARQNPPAQNSGADEDVPW